MFQWAAFEEFWLVFLTVIDLNFLHDFAAAWVVVLETRDEAVVLLSSSRIGKSSGSSKNQGVATIGALALSVLLLDKSKSEKVERVEVVETGRSGGVDTEGVERSIGEAFLTGTWTKLSSSQLGT